MEQAFSPTLQNNTLFTHRRRFYYNGTVAEIVGQLWEDLHGDGLVGVGSPRSGSCLLSPRLLKHVQNKRRPIVAKYERGESLVETPLSYKQRGSSVVRSLWSYVLKMQHRQRKQNQPLGQHYCRCKQQVSNTFGVEAVSCVQSFICQIA